MEIRARIDHIEAGHRADPFGGISRVGHAALRRLPETLCPHGRQVHRCGHGTEGLIGADVGAGFFPADMLFPGLEREDIGSPAVMVGGLTHDAPRQLSGHGAFGRHKA